jgi:hypothetical protein
MTTLGITKAELMKLLQSLTEASRKVRGADDDAYAALVAARKSVENMLADYDVLESLEDDYRKGNIMTTDYYLTRKRTITDFYSNRTDLLEGNLVDLANKIPDQERKSALDKLKSVVTNPDFIAAATSILQAVLRIGH